MDANLKKILRGISLELRHELEGWHDKKTGVWNPGDLERRLNEIGAWGDRPSKPLDEMPHLSAEDKTARRLVDGYLQLRAEAGVERAAAVAEFVRESAYTWANRLFALRCMEVRSIIDEVILQKAAYAGRSLVHQRYLRKNPDAAKGDDDGLFAVLFAEFAVRCQELPALFDPKSPAVALRPSVAALKHCVALLSGTETVRGQEAATDEVFAAPDAFGWAYQYWNADEKDRVFEMVRTKKGARIQGADIIPATQLYTEPYMVKFLVQNSLGALWMGMYPDSKMCERWEYYVNEADRAPVARKPVREITFLDPAEGSGHFHLEAFDLFYAMYEAEAACESRTLTPRAIAAAILNHNLYGIDIDGRSVQIATAALWMKAKERAPDLEAEDITNFHEHLVATNIRLPKGKDHLELFLQKHPEDKDLRPALELVFQGLEHADELGALLQIEELVDAVLRRLKQEADGKKGTVVQTGLFEPTLIQGTLPVSVENYDKWKRDALKRLQTHFEAEAQAADPVQAFFGESVGRGLTFFKVLSNRYDVVTANPPYMGSKNMPDTLREHVELRYRAGKRDLYAAFMLRCVSFVCFSGRVALVAPQSWMFLSSYVDLRACDEEKSKKGTTSGDLLRKVSFETLAQLGRHAFSEIDPPCNVTLVVWAACPPRDEHRIWCFRLSSPRLAAEQASILRSAMNGMCESIITTPRQSRFLKIPKSPLCFWLTERLFEILDWQRMEDFAAVRQGLATTDNPRFLRFVWEAYGPNSRWVAYVKGGGYRKWIGLESLCVEWGSDGIRVKETILRDPATKHWSRRASGREFYFRPGLTYTLVARGGFGVRLLPANCIFDVSGTSIFPHDERDLGYIAALCNTRLSTFLLRVSTQSLSYHAGYVARLPVKLDNKHGVGIRKLAAFCCDIKARLTSWDLTEGRFLNATNLLEWLPFTTALTTVEGVIESMFTGEAGLGIKDTSLVFDETGSPAGRFPLIKGYDRLDEFNNLATLPSEGIAHLALHERVEIAADALTNIKRQLALLFQAGFNAAPEADDSESGAESSQLEVESDEEEITVGACIPVPAECLVEELSQKLEVHPISIYWMLKEGIEREGWRCPPEERRLKEERFTILVLRLLGHRWPKQLEAGDPLPAWSDQDGVISITSGGGETPLIERVCERLAEDFPGSNVTALKREFEEIVGVNLEQWLAGPFFERHISQFKKRPIAWQLETVASRQAAVPGGKGKKKRAVAGKPVFACLVYYHKLDADLLPKIRTQYVGLLRDGFETEFRTLERLPNPTGDQQARRLDLEQWTDELQAFDRLLEDVSLRGFGPDALLPALRQYAINDALLSLTASWLRRLSETVVKGPMSDWAEAATKTELHPDLSKWLQDSLSHLNHFCAVLGPKPPDEQSFTTDPTSKELASVICHEAKSMVESSLKLGCDRWWKLLDAAVLEPLRQEIKITKEEIEKIDEELKAEGLQFQRRNELGERKHELKVRIKSIRSDHDEKSDRARKVRSQIEKWTCPEAETWEAWLSAQPLFDAVTSLDGQRPPPQSIADFTTQESRYAPDINDGVRVNVAPMQKAGLLHADVLDAKDADKAIADRAEWRADERRWVREGKLPQPGWWKESEARL